MLALTKGMNQVTSVRPEGAKIIMSLKTILVVDLHTVITLIMTKPVPLKESVGLDMSLQKDAVMTTIAKGRNVNFSIRGLIF